MLMLTTTEGNCKVSLYAMVMTGSMKLPRWSVSGVMLVTSSFMKIGRTGVQKSLRSFAIVIHKRKLRNRSFNDNGRMS